MCCAVSRALRWSRRRDTDHAPDSAASAEEHTNARTKFAELPARVDVFEHRGDEDALYISASGQERDSSTRPWMSRTSYQRGSLVGSRGSKTFRRTMRERSGR
jgi:hypothetical protein